LFYTSNIELKDKLNQMLKRSLCIIIQRRVLGNQNGFHIKPFLRALSTQSEAAARILYGEDNSKLVVTLPSKGTTSLPISKNRPIGCLLLDIKDEDPSVEKVEVLDSNGYKISNSTLALDALRDGSKLLLNGSSLDLQFPTLEEILEPKLKKIEELKEKIKPYEDLKQLCDLGAQRFANRVAWLGLFALCTQWGLMMRLTWYEFSWDVMEPIAYFLSFGTGILGYSFYLLTKRDYTYEGLEGHTVTRRQLKLYTKKGLDIKLYYSIYDSINHLENEVNLVKQRFQNHGRIL